MAVPPDITPRTIVMGAAAVVGGIALLILLILVVSAFKSTPVDSVGLSTPAARSQAPTSSGW